MTGEADATYWKNQHAALLRSHAELVEADAEYDAASVAFDAAPGNVQSIGDTDGRDYDGPEYLRLVRAIERRRTALANCKPEGGK